MNEPGSEWEPAGHLRAIAHGIDDGVVILVDRKVRWASPRFAELLGVIDALSLIGRPIDSLLEDTGSGLPGDCGFLPVACHLRAETGLRDVEIRLCASAAAERGPGGELSEEDAADEVWLIREVPRVQRVEDELYSARRALHDTNREVARLRNELATEVSEREELLNVVSHELRTPVTVIRGYNNLLLSEQVGDLNEQQEEFLRESNRSCERLNAFIADLQAASGDPNGGRLPDLASASLEPLIEGVLKFLRPLLQERQLEVELDLSPDALGARFDAPRIEQVLTNLLSNAIRHAEPRSSVGVRTLLLAAAGHRFVEVSVSDSGPGIPPQDRERIFEPYVRTGDDRTGSGLGLGLAICKRIVQSHGGTIGVFDFPERRGSRFAFTLLAADLPEAS